MSSGHDPDCPRGFAPCNCHVRDEKELKEAFKNFMEAIERAQNNKSNIIRRAILKAKSRYGGLRPAARALKIDVAYLQRLQNGDKTNPSDDTLRKLRLL